MKKLLTALALKALRPTGQPYYISDAKADGLRVRVAASGSLSWSVVYRVKGSGVRSTSLGRADPRGQIGLDLEAAREKAAAILKAARQGTDLVQEQAAAKEVAKTALTCERLVELYVKTSRAQTVVAAHSALRRRLSDD